jgi:hypothetical protein
MLCECVGVEYGIDIDPETVSFGSGNEALMEVGMIILHYIDTFISMMV